MALLCFIIGGNGGELISPIFQALIFWKAFLPAGFGDDHFGAEFVEFVPQFFGF